MEPVDLAMLEKHGAERRTLDAGEPVFFEHQIGAEMFAVVRGRVDILTYGKVLENVGPGGIFGEMALLENTQRAAAALAAEPTEVAVIPRDLFLTLVREEPAFALHVMRVLANRLRRK